MTSRLLKLFAISWLATFTLLSTGITVGAKKTPPKPKDPPKAVAKKTVKGKEKVKDKEKAKAKAKAKEGTAASAGAKDGETSKDPAKPITKDRKGHNVAGVLYGSAGFATLVTMPFTTRSKKCPPPRVNPSPSTPKTNQPCP